MRVGNSRDGRRLRFFLSRPQLCQDCATTPSDNRPVAGLNRPRAHDEKNPRSEPLPYFKNANFVLRYDYAAIMPRLLRNSI